ncbi:MAG TPA: PAS domain-containing protein [Rhizomicrobium sp.]|jgi:hypothetical protein
MSAVPTIAAHPPKHDGYIENPAEVDNPILAFFLDYWRQKRGASPLPARIDIQIRDFPQYLRWVVLLDAEEELSEFRFRVVGSSVARYFLSDATGTTLSQAYAHAGRDLTELTRMILQRTCKRRVPTRLTGPQSTWKGTFFPNWDALYLPISEDRQMANAILCVFTFNYEEFKRTGDMAAFRLF